MTRVLVVVLVASAGCRTTQPVAAPAARAAPCPAALPAAAQDIGVGWYVVENEYYAKEGLADDVLRTRTEASAAIAALGLASGTVMRGPGGDGPDVIWRSAPFRSLAEIKPFNERALADPRFLAAYQHMGTLLRRFVRARYVIVTYEAHDTGQ